MLELAAVRVVGCIICYTLYLRFRSHFLAEWNGHACVLFKLNGTGQKGHHFYSSYTYNGIVLSLLACQDYQTIEFCTTEKELPHLSL